MSLVSGLAVYFMTWWLVLFAVLPWGNRVEDNQEEEKGFAGSAPQNPRIKLKFLITSIVSLVIWFIIFLLVEYETIDFHSLSNEKS